MREGWSRTIGLGAVLLVACMPKSARIKQAAWDQAVPMTKMACKLGVAQQDVQLVKEGGGRAEVIVCGVSYICNEDESPVGWQCILKDAISDPDRKKVTDGSGKPAAGAPDGHERGNCYGNGTCNEGLQCLSGLCVRPK